MKVIDTKVENPEFLNKYLEISTAEVIVLNPATKQEIFMAYLESDSLDQKVDEEKIKAGISNDTIAVINKNKEITFEVSEQVSRKEMQLAKLQAVLKSGTIEAYQFPEVKTVSSKKIELSKTPIDNDEVNIYDNTTGKRLDPSKCTIETVSDKTTVTFADELNLADNSKVTVSSYRYLTEASYADIGKDSIPSVVSLIVRKPLYNTEDKIVCWKQYIFPKAKMDSNISLKGNTEKKANPETTKFTIMHDDKEGITGRILYIPVEI